MSIIKSLLGLSEKNELGTILSIKETNKKNIKELKKTRDSSISWLTDRKSDV
jgi:hypothetical protein